MTDQEFLQQLYDYKVKNKFSYRKLAKLVSISHSTIIPLLMGKRVITTKTKFKIFKFFNNLDITTYKIFNDHATAVKYYRLMLGFSHRKLAKLAGHADKSTIQGLEKRKANHRYSPSTILALEKIIGREIVTREYFPCDSKSNIAHNILKKKFKDKNIVAKKLNITSTHSYYLLNRLDLLSENKVRQIAKAIGVHYSIFYDFSLATKYFKNQGATC